VFSIPNFCSKTSPHLKGGKMSLEKDALVYHSDGRPGKLEVIPTKPSNTERDLALAYSPGVAYPCLEIQKQATDAFKYTNRGNLVAVISDGTAVLGLGNIGALAGKPVMEGKGVLFKRFANIDVFDIEVEHSNPDDFVNIVKSLEPTFGGINLEDIKAPECFYIEEALKEKMNIPVFHDDQHGTAIVSAAALKNAAEISGKNIAEMKLVVNGAGASAIACTKLFMYIGIKKENIIMCDSKGVVYKGRKEGMNKYKEEFATDSAARTLAEAMKDANVFVGLSVAGAVTQDMVKSMAPDPIIFAMANPTPEILPEQAKEVRPDVMMATGRSDYPNQVNNVLGFPFIFRGAMDVKATCINEEMKIAAAEALASLAKEEIPESVVRAYGGKHFKFGREYLLPKPFDPRVLLNVAPAVAKAAMDSGVAQEPIEDFDAYHDKLEAMLGAEKSFVRTAIHRVHSYAEKEHEDLPRIVFPEAEEEKVLRAIQIIVEERIAHPVLLGQEDIIREKIQKLEINNLKDIPIWCAKDHPRYNDYVAQLLEKRQRKGVQGPEARRLMKDPDYFAAMAVEMGDAEGMISGATHNYTDSIRPILQVIGPRKMGVVTGLIIMVLDNKVTFFTDTSININPSAKEIACGAFYATEVAEYFGIDPKVAMLSFTSFAANEDSPRKMQEAVQLFKELRPDVMIDGDIQADAAINEEVCRELFPFSELKKSANILAFPDLNSANISYKLVQHMGNGQILGPFLMGIRKPAHVLPRSCGVDNIVNTVAMTALQVQAIKGAKKK
jgi:malate dehydrogenase (oxaloacetate-decarboxylating)(NADP+)